MPKPICPKCKGRLIANPIGHWYAKFKCAHCGAALQFTPVTNVLGMAGSLIFVVTVAALVLHGYATLGWRLLVAASCLWIVLNFLSYQLRSVIEDSPKR